VEAIVSFPNLKTITMKKLMLPVFALLILIAFKAPTLRTVTGTVVSAADGLPIPYIDIKSLPSKKTFIADLNGKFNIQVSAKDTALQISGLGYEPQRIKLGRANTYQISLKQQVSKLNEVVVIGYGSVQKRAVTGSISAMNSSPQWTKMLAYPQERNTETYNAINENGFRLANKNPLSTFSIDVDAAAYTNVRRFINNGTLPPKDAVRIEEMINYFDYDYAQPTGTDPVHIVTEMGAAPWNTKHRLLQVGIKGKTIPTTNLPAANLVFLIDVSGSMEQPNKLPLLISSLKLLSDQLRPKDKVAIVVYAGSSGLILPSTPGDQKTKIKEVLQNLHAGGGTAGGQGITLAYKVAMENFIPGGNNRVILATDGDFNVGLNSDSDLQRLIEEKRKSGVFLTVLGYGMGNYKDSKMEVLADKGNGNYAYIDNLTEAKKVLVNEFGGTLFTIAKDVKLQLEFNPKIVQAYRLIGYENRLLNDEDFNDDQKDAGDLGAGHTVTALYEIIPVGIQSNFVGSVDDLKYQQPKLIKDTGGEVLTIKLRYKSPVGDKSKLLQKVVIDEQSSLKKPSENFSFAAAVAEFGMLLRQSEFKQQGGFEQVIALATAGKGKDSEGYRSEFVRLVGTAQLMAKDLLTTTVDQTTNKK
jgi:Ca-activated chloride channel family protein